MRALNIGGTGFISLHLAQSLLRQGHEVTVFHTAHKLRLDLGIRPRYTLPSGLAQTWAWYRSAGLCARPVDFAVEDQLLAKIGA